MRNPESYDPVDMLSGAYVFDRSDLSLSGAGVRGLNFSRHYSSLAAGQTAGMGKGWSHGYDSSIVVHSDPEAALGVSSPQHAASLLVATRVVSDLVDLPTSPKAWVVNSIAAWWGLEEIFENTVTVRVGRNTIPFTKLADGSFLPPPGMTSQLSQDPVTMLYTLEERFDEVAEFNADLKLDRLVDADGNQKTFSYVGGKLDTVTDATGRMLSFSYTDDRLTQVTDSTGRTVTYGYTGDLLTSATDPETHTTTYSYDAEDRIETVRNQKNETVVENTYDALGQICFQEAEGDPDQAWEYAFTGVLNVEINPDRDILSYLFTPKGLTSEVINGAGEITRMTYDGQNQLVRTEDARGNITRFEYDGRNNLRFTYDARNGETGTTYKVENQYDAEDRLVKVIDQEGNETLFEYDAENHLIRITDPELRETVTTYYTSGPHDGLPHTVTTPGTTTGQTLTTTIQYDTWGYPATTTRPDGSVVTQTFNARGDLLLSEVTTSGETNTYPVTRTYDLNRRLLATQDDLNFGGSFSYDPVGNLISTTDRFGNTSTATFSPMARMETATGPNSETITTLYDDSGRVDSVSDPLSQTTRLTYDLAGRLETTENPAGEVVTYEYDAAGNQDRITNARNKAYPVTFTANNLRETLTTPLGRVFTTTYDDRLLPETIEEPSGETTTFDYFDDGLLKQTVDLTGTITYEYDAKGRLTTVTEGTDVISRSYDELDRIESFTDSQGNTIGYEFDGDSNLTTLTYPGSKGNVIYAYDNAGRLTTVTDWAGRITQFLYDIHSRLEQVLYPNGIVCTYTYDSAGRIQSQTDTRSSDQTVILEQNFTYDVLNRIVEEKVLPEPAMFSIPATLMTYDDDDRVASWQSDAVNVTPVFDLDGNMTSGPLEGSAQTFVYDTRNRLTQAGSAVYSYDAEDRRISKTESGVTTNYVHDPHGGLSKLLQKTSGGVTTTYVYAGGRLLYEETGGQIRVYHFDTRGSTLAITDLTGGLSNRFTYGVYGELVLSSSTPATPFLYNGAFGVQTDDNGLLQMRARYYTTDLRRFLNADPIGFGGGMNWYAFANGNPFMLMDPFGLCAEGGNILQRGVQAYSEGLGLTYNMLNNIGWQFWNAVGAIAAAPDQILNWATGTDEYDRTNIALTTPIPLDDVVVGGLGMMSRTGNALRQAGRLDNFAPIRTPNEAGVVREFVTEADQTFYRVFSGDATQGKFLTAVPPRSSAYAQEALALPRANTADLIQEVTVPAGTTLRRSRAAPLQANDLFPTRRGGAEQFELMDFLDEGTFGPGSPLQ
jgi:RHS repeat-associated protein